MTNLRHWDRFADIDPKFTKPITGKSYRGTSPNPQYVIRCLTEIFGPVGEGFGWDVVAEDFVPIGDEVLHWCRIRFWHTDRANAFDSYGQTKALMKTRNGPMLDEDAPKKSLTDAIIKAASHVGIAANIFLGRWDDQKYVAQVNAEYREKEAPPHQSDDSERGLNAAFYDGIRDSLPKDATTKDHAGAIAAAISKDLAAKKSIKGLDDTWERHKAMTERISRAFSDLGDQIIDAYEIRKNELTEPAPINERGYPALAGDAIPY